MKISEAFDRYRRDVICFSNQSSKTEEHHLTAQSSLVAFVGDIEIEQLTFDKIRDWKIHQERKGLSAETIRGYLIKLRVVLKHFKRLNYPCLDPDTILLPKRSQKPPMWLTAKQVTELIDSTSSLQAKTIISLLYASGIRVSELCAMNRGDVKEDCTFTVVGKGGKARLCFIDKRTCNLLSLALAARDDNNPALFVSRLSKKRITPANVQEIFKHLRKKCGYQETISPHWIRHSYATNLMQNGAHIYTVSRLLGHSNIQTTATYLHVTDLHLKEEYEKYHQT